MALMAALFMIIVVAALGAFAVRLSANEQQTANLELLSARADAMAYSGLEFGANRLAKGVGICTPVPPTSFVADGFTVTVRCPAPSNHTISGVDYQIYDLTATATRGNYGNPDFVQRTATRRVPSAPW
jgi:MSHA biogenesis protein MshP